MDRGIIRFGTPPGEADLTRMVLHGLGSSSKQYSQALRRGQNGNEYRCSNGVFNFRKPSTPIGKDLRGPRREGAKVFAVGFKLKQEVSRQRL